MSIVGTVLAACPACGTEQDVELVQSINTITSPDAKRKLLAGELNLLACECGRVTQLAANVLFHDPDADYYAWVHPGSAAEIEDAGAILRASGATGRQRLVPSINALVEKVKLLDAQLDDWVVELIKVLLLATIGDLDRVLLFDRVDRDADAVHWVLFEGRDPQPLVSPLSAYSRLAATATPPAATELQIDRAWAVGAAQALIAAAN